MRPGPPVIRRARATDYATFVRLFPELGVDDPVPPRALWEAGLAPSTIIAESSELATPALGYLYCQEYADTGYVRHLVAAPEARRTGVGQALMRFAGEALRAAHKRRWCLNVKSANLAARGLYAHLGFEVAYPAVVVRMPWAILELLSDGAMLRSAGSPRTVAGRLLEPSRYALVEACFGLPGGQLAAAARQHRVLLEAVPDGCGGDEGPVGCAAFDPTFPGAFPFRLLDPGALGPMLRALQTHALPTLAYVQLVFELVEPAERVALDRILAAGGDVRDHVLHLEGRL